MKKIFNVIFACIIIASLTVPIVSVLAQNEETSAAQEGNVSEASADSSENTDNISEMNAEMKSYEVSDDLNEKVQLTSLNEASAETDEKADEASSEIPAEEEGEESSGESSGESEGVSSGESEGDSSGEEITEQISQSEITTQDGYQYVSLVSLAETDDDESKLCLILIPEEYESTDFIEEQRWQFHAAIHKIDLVFLSGDWSDEDSSDVYFTSVYQDSVENSMEVYSDIFLIGYKSGADYAAAQALAHSDSITGLVMIGGNGLPDELTDEYGDSDDVSHLSVWIINDKKTADTSDDINFWKELNDITGSASKTFRCDFADELYLPATSTADKISDTSNKMGCVLYSRENDYMDDMTGGQIARNFVDTVSSDRIEFHETITGTEIFSFNDRRFTYFRRQFEGQQRDYWVFVPKAVMDPDAQCSLILCLHGNGGNGEDMIFRSRWHETADDNNCVVVYPSSLYLRGTQHYWLNNDEELAFLRELIDSICEDYPIDRSRIYVTGFSNGAGMSQNLAVRFSDIIAAAAMVAPAYFDEEYFGSPVTNVHEVAVLFSYGTEDEYLKAFKMTADIYDIPAVSHLAYWRSLYGFRQEFNSCVTEDIFTTYTFTTKYYIPVCKWMIVDGINHDYPKMETGLIYDFLKEYTKDEQGNLYYNGIRVYSK